MDPRGATGVPPRETGKEENTPAVAAGEPAPGSAEAETQPEEGQEVARGAYPPSPSGSLSGKMLTLDFGPLALGPRRDHPPTDGLRGPDGFLARGLNSAAWQMPQQPIKDFRNND